jgi:hypothetical protein
MRHVHLFEFTDLAWYPQIFRQMQTDYLQFATSLGTGHQNLVPLFRKALDTAGTLEIVDLCSGGAGPWIHLQEQLRLAGMTVTVTLTDKFPQSESVQAWKRADHLLISYLPEPVDALNVPEHLKGMRTMFEGFHHFKPEQAQAILQDAAEKKVAIGIFEASFKPPFGIVLLILSPLITFLTYLLITPFLKPQTWQRFLWTYLVPIVPLATCWDGIISMLRVYSSQALQELTSKIEAIDYAWEIGSASTGTPIFVFTYLIGYPNSDRIPD